MKREISLTGDLKGSRCCPGHDKWPNDSYRSNRSKRARSKTKQIEHQVARARAKASLRKDNDHA